MTEDFGGQCHPAGTYGLYNTRLRWSTLAFPPEIRLTPVRDMHILK